MQSGCRAEMTAIVLGSLTHGANLRIVMPCSCLILVLSDLNDNACVVVKLDDTH